MDQSRDLISGFILVYGDHPLKLYKFYAEWWLHTEPISRPERLLIAAKNMRLLGLHAWRAFPYDGKPYFEFAKDWRMLHDEAAAAMQCISVTTRHITAEEIRYDRCSQCGHCSSGGMEYPT